MEQEHRLRGRLFDKPETRVLRWLAKRTGNPEKGWSYADASDARQQVKVEHKMEQILWALEFGLVSNQPTLRDLEALLPKLGSRGQRLVGDAISDTTLHTEAQRLDLDYLHGQLVRRVRDMHRSKMLPAVELPFGVATIDGKNLATLEHSASGTGHKRTSENAKWHRSSKEEGKTGKEYYLMPALRAVLASAEAKPAIYQMALPPGVGESSRFVEMLEGLDEAYGRSAMFELVDADAGLTSLANASAVISKGWNYVFGLKGNQKELFEEAKALLEPMAASTAPEAETLWERRNGKSIRRRLWRTSEMAGITNSAGTWSHLRQTWLVRQETVKSDGTTEIEDRYFVTSLDGNRLSASQILWLVRMHWSIENDAFGSLDLQWREDSAPWCTKGTAIWGLSLLRLMAYNTAQLVRRRRLRPKDLSGRPLKPMRWRQLFKILEAALILELEVPAPAV